MHAEFAAAIIQSNWRVIHVAFHLLIIVLVVGFVPMLPVAALIVGIGSVNASFYLLYRWVAERLTRDAAPLLALALLIAAPITMFTPKHHYLGYIGFHSVHSPTMVLLKPFALVVFGLVVAALTGRLRLTAKRGAAVAALCIVCTFVKPNFALSLIPAMVVILSWRLAFARHCITKPFVAWSAIIGGTLTVTLALQYVAQYLLIDSDSGGVAFAPLASLMIWEPSSAWLAVKFVMSIAFPLVVILLYGGHLRRATDLQLAWLIFVFGAAQMYLLTETGKRAEAGNFWWSAQIGAFILFAASAVHWLGYQRGERRWRFWTALIVFLLHTASGITFLILHLFVTVQGTFW